MTSFEQKILALLVRIPRGKVATYSSLARAAGKPRAVRAAANAVGKNPDAPRVPCHRVVRSDGTLGGYSAPGGVARKIELLRKEGVKISRGRVDLSRHNFSFRV